MGDSGRRRVTGGSASRHETSAVRRDACPALVMLHDLARTTLSEAPVVVQNTDAAPLVGRTLPPDRGPHSAKSLADNTVRALLCASIPG